MPGSPRVLVVAVSLEIGGTERHLLRTVPLLRQAGIHVDVLALDRSGPVVAEMEAAGISVGRTRLTGRRGGSRALHLGGAVEDVRRAIVQGGYDIVHSHLHIADAVATLAARLSGPRRVIVSRRAMHPWRRPSGPLSAGVEMFSNVLAGELIANSWTVLRDVEARERFLPRRRTVIHNGIDASLYRPARGSGSGPLQMVTVGRLSARKGQEYALEAVRILSARGVAVHLTLVGSGPDEAMLRGRARGLEGLVTFAGEHPDPRPHLEAADLFLLPARQEGFANAVLEAMACSLPLVATDVGGNGEALVDGEGGRLVPAGDAGAIARAVEDLALDRPALRAMGRANRVRVERFFTLERSVARVAAWYRDPDDVSDPSIEPGPGSNRTTAR